MLKRTCEIGKVSQATCRRKAVTNRVTGKGITIWLCSKCATKHGDTIEAARQPGIIHRETLDEYHARTESERIADANSMYDVR